MMAKFCGNCGKPLGENDKVCGNCGTPVTINETVPPIAQSRTASKAINGKKATVIGGALLAVIVLAVVLIKGASRTTPKPNTSSTSSVPSSSATQQIAANSSTPDGEPTPIPAAEKETIEEKAKKAINELEVWDGSVAESFDGGDGSEENPYQIANGAQLAKLAQDTNSGIDFNGKFFVLTSDIMLNDISRWSFKKSAEENAVNDGITSSESDNVWNSIGWLSYSASDDFNVEKDSEAPFSGSFNGDNHTIWGLCARNASGLFGYVKGMVVNTNVACGSIGCFYSGGVGIIAGWIYDTNIRNCQAEHVYIRVSEMTGGGIGGICGIAEGDCAIYDCSSKKLSIDSQESYRSEIGGIAGTLLNDSNGHSGRLNISYSYSECNIKVECAYMASEALITYNRVGGICGLGTNFLHCISNCSIEYKDFENKGDGFVNCIAGGIVGACSGCISDCGSSGNISGVCNTEDKVTFGFGGIATNVYRTNSDTSDISINNCYNSCALEVKNGEESQYVKTNGLVCNIYSDDEEKIKATVTNCYFVPSTSDEAIGFCGNDITLFTDQVVSVSSESDLKKSDTYLNWDFENVWVIDDKINNGLPIPRSLLEIIG